MKTLELVGIGESEITRFWSKVEKTEGCWNWIGGLMTTGYGEFSVGPRSNHYVFYAHRVAYELIKGHIPMGLVIDHLCRNPRCVNPSHLEVVTQGENAKRGHALITHCRLGHPYSGDNLYTNPNTGYRQCKTCAKTRW